MQRHWLIAIVATFALALLMTFPGFLPGRVLLPLDHPRDLGAWKPDPNARYEISNKIVSDPIYEYLAWDREIRRLLHSGQMPWRNGWAGDGAHLYANPETAILFPFTWPRLLLGDRGWVVTALLKLWAGALGMWWLSGRLSPESRPALRLIAGAVYATSGYMTVWLLFPHTNVFAVLPWLAGCAVQWMREPGRKWSVALVTTAAMAPAGGPPQTLFHGVVALAAFLTIGFWRQRRRLPVIAVAAAVGFLIVAVQLVPFLVALSKSDIVRTRDAATSHHVRIFAAVAQVLPGFLGSPLRGEIDLSGIAQPAAENFNERSSGYAGAITLLALAAAWRRLSRELRLGIFIGLASLVISWRLPVIDDALRAIPLFSVAANERFGLVFILFACAAIPAALTIVADSARRVRSGVVMAVLAGLLALVAMTPAIPAGRTLLLSAAQKGITVMQQRQFLRKPRAYYDDRLQGYLDGVKKVAVRRVAVPAALIAMAGAALAMRGRRATIIGAAAVAETMLFAWGYAPAVHVDEAAKTPAVVLSVREHDPRRSFLIAASTGVYDANLATIDRVRDIRSYDVLQESSRIERLVLLGFDRDSRAVPDDLRPEAVAGLAREGVRFFLSRRAPPGARFVGGLPPPAVGAYELPGSRPVPWPANTAPSGLAAGAIVSMLALAASIALFRFLPYHKF